MANWIYTWWPELESNQRHEDFQSSLKNIYLARHRKSRAKEAIAGPQGLKLVEMPYEPAIEGEESNAANTHKGIIFALKSVILL